jgi:CPA2 family monovalent cation:H+ antiporter-2
MEGLGTHPFEAQRRTKDFERNDRAALRALAEVYDPDVPGHLRLNSTTQ